VVWERSQPATAADPGRPGRRVSVCATRSGTDLVSPATPRPTVFSGPAEYPWDMFLLTNRSGQTWFDGPTAVAFMVALLPVTTLANGEGYAHLANTTTEPLAAT